MAATTQAFTGFQPEAIQFLADLADNNERSWFQPRKGDFERLLKGPLEALCVALDERFRERGIPLTADPVTSPFRIYRDVRFSKDKSPYKTHISASFPSSTATPRPARTSTCRPARSTPGAGCGTRTGHGSRPGESSSIAASGSRRWRTRRSWRRSARSTVTRSVASRRASPRTIRAPSCSSSRTSPSDDACRTTRRPRPTCPTPSPTRMPARSRSSACWAGCPT